MFPMVLPLPRTSISWSVGVVCFLAQAGSAAMSIGFMAGGVPAKVIVPVMDEAAKAAFGDTAMRLIASHNLVPVQRMFGSLLATTATWSPSTTPRSQSWGDSTRGSPQAQSGRGHVFYVKGSPVVNFVRVKRLEDF